MTMKNGVDIVWGWAVLVRATPRHKWHIGYNALFTLKKAAEQFAQSAELGGETRVVRASMRAAV